MSTAKQIAANRRNAQKSTGPRTTEGKAKTRLNPLKHGLTETIVLPFENPDDYRELQQSVLDDLRPKALSSKSSSSASSSVTGSPNEWTAPSAPGCRASTTCTSQKASNAPKNPKPTLNPT